ncbi:uncharacterized protein K452DRAFT_60475 [Aplosporella prunicola CBS 121167]|uniref:Uncharacterized protein n=1 Tax=Aplosporella prunicola CBS 121167 TaxID=1176127 RepID=A0A6A6B834_9PEZI|nr:uncharacterized protein K452DRAFT_60475 [Aplosporella prunicola CBS 121167]KAF2140076.1 hypothetical protein K452DRAFT_60475 [Aplosporella prunicola CBS 121167]
MHTHHHHHAKRPTPAPTSLTSLHIICRRPILLAKSMVEPLRPGVIPIRKIPLQPHLHAPPATTTTTTTTTTTSLHKPLGSLPTARTGRKIVCPQLVRPNSRRRKDVWPRQPAARTPR